MSGRALIIGAGNIGRATGAQLAASGLGVTFFDTDPDVVRALSASGSETLESVEGLPPFDLVHICVPTPTVDGRFSTVHLENALATAGTLLITRRTFTTVVVRSTLLPGMMDTLVRRLLARHAPAGSWGLAYRPSFARERSAVEDELAPRVAIIGYDQDPRTREQLEPTLASVSCPVHWVSFRDAELAKYGANLLNVVKISYFNALGAWTKALGGDPQRLAELVAQASEANWNPDYGYRSVGQPFGGECLPKDLDAFLGFLAERGTPHAEILAAARTINQSLGGPAQAAPSAARP